MVVRALPCHRLGGLEFHTLDLVNALRERGHSVVVVTSAHPYGRPNECLASGAEVYYSPSGRPGDYSVGFSRGAEELLERLDRDFSFDIIHLQELAGLFVAHRPGRTVCTVHGTMFSETPLNRRYFRRMKWGEKLRALWRFKPRLLLYPRFRRMLQRADELLADSDYTRRELLRSNPALRPRIHLVPLGLDLSRYSNPENSSGLPGEGELPVRIALLGRVQRMKGLEVALQAADLLKQRGVRFRMEIGGTGDYLDLLAAEVDRRGLRDNVTLAGRVPPEDLPRFFGGADLFLFPDLTQPAFGLVALEAMLYGLPVVGTRSGAIPEVVREEVGWLYSPWDANELAVLLERLCHCPAEIRRKGERARAHALQFSAGQMAEGVEEVYRRVAARRR